MTDHQQAVQHQVDRLLNAMADMAIAEYHGNDEGTLTGFVVGFRAARDSLILTGPAGSAFDALEQLALAIREHVKEELDPSD